MTYPEALRSYADWLEAHLELGIEKGHISHYNNDAVVPQLIEQGGTITDCPGHDIIYVTLPAFAPLRIEFIVRKDVIMAPAIEGGKVIWSRKPEYAEAAS